MANQGVSSAMARRKWSGSGGGVWMREDGTAVDKIVLMTDADLKQEWLAFVHSITQWMGFN